LRHHADLTYGITADSIRRLVGQLAASMPTCGLLPHSYSCGTSLSPNNVGRTSSLHYY
jgi:hypothetical protein